MQTNAKTTSLFICVSVLAFLARGAYSQVGPNPGEIPQLPSQSVLDTDGDSAGAPSDSASVRNAMDEILLAKARESAGTPPSENLATSSNSVSNDLRSGTDALPIGQSSPRSTLIGARDSENDSAFGAQGYLQTIVALLGVILLIVGLGQVYKRLAKAQGGLAGQLGAGGSAPSGIIEVIGRYPISKGMTLVVLRFDRKVLLLSHASSSKGKSGRAASMELLCELGDPEDVASILLKARTASGESIAQSFEQTLREADELTDDHLRDVDMGFAEVNPVRFPSQRTEPVRTITTDEGDRAELWSSGQDTRAAAGVLRHRLASMRREQG
jgi:flagellar biogenesis protein FliO